MVKRFFSGLFALALAVSNLSCVEPSEAPSVQLDVMVDRSGIVTSKNDRGYTITLSQARVVIENIAFAVGGEEHGKEGSGSAAQARAGIPLLSWFVRPAYAHPGHFEGGEVTGELNGRFVLDWLAKHQGPRKVGTAMLLYGEYTSANFVLGRGGVQDGLVATDPLFGHTAHLKGVATKDGVQVPFVAVLDAPKGREVLGVPFELEVSQTTRAPLGFRLHTLGVIKAESLFDGVEFGKLTRNDGGVAEIHAQTQDPEARRAYARIRRSLQTQEQFDIKATTMRALARQAVAPDAT